MKLSDAITKANGRASKLQGLRVKSDERSRLAASLFAIAQQHQSAILLLLNNPQILHASAFSLLRLLIEVTIRGVWVSSCATEDQVINVIEGNQKQLDTASMFVALEKALNKDSDCCFGVKKLYDLHWKVLSAYTHSYEQQVQRWLGTKDIEPSYSTDEIEELIFLCDLVANLAFVFTQSLSVGESN